MVDIHTEIVICGLCKSSIMREILGAVVYVPLSNDVQGKRPDGPISYLHSSELFSSILSFLKPPYTRNSLPAQMI
jgi:hypothetical protein